MEDRKRPALDDTYSSAPSSKRQAVAINGAPAHPDTDMPWRNDIDEYQKDAIFRQMKDYKRQVQDLEAQMAAMVKKSAYHDDHLRAIDVWFTQLLDEMALIAEENPPAQGCDKLLFSSALLATDESGFEVHLASRSKEIKAVLPKLLTRSSEKPTDVRDLNARLSRLLLAEKNHISELQHLTFEKDQLSERLENASYRYMVAEKKLDRAKSAQVAKLEAQAISAARPEMRNGQDGSGQEDVKTDNESKTTNQSSTVEQDRKEAAAKASKQSEQLEKMAEENKQLSDLLTASQFKNANLTDEDYANTGLFKAFKSQYEDMVKRINDLEATHVQLRTEIKQLQSERTSFKEGVDTDMRNATIEMESQLARTEADLARIRHARDELVADLGVRKATQDQQDVSTHQIKELSIAQESRIGALESEIERLRSDNVATDTPADTDTGDSTILQMKISNLEKEKGLLENELRSMEFAYKKATTIANKKISEIVDVEERTARLTAEKAKADQKYFGAMKAKETRETEIRALRQQNSKSSEIVSQLKEAESGYRTLVTTLEKQLAEVKDSLSALTVQQRSTQQSQTAQKLTNDRLSAQVEELKTTLVSKNAATQEALQTHRQSEVELSQLKIRLDDAQKKVDTWKKKSLGSQNEEYEMLRTLAICTVCRTNFKDTVLKTCGHTLCKSCVDERITSRLRKCPHCGKAFGKDDSMHMTL